MSGLIKMGYCREVKNDEELQQGVICGGNVKEFPPKLHYWDYYGKGVTLVYERWCPKCYIVTERVEHYSECSEPQFD